MNPVVAVVGSICPSILMIHPFLAMVEAGDMEVDV